MTDWPFDDPPIVAVVTTLGVMQRGEWIAYVSHDDVDGTWQFHTNQPVRMEDAALVALKEVVRIDPTLIEVADLPCGWKAERSSPVAVWIRSELPPETDV